MIIALDVGTSSARAAVFDHQGRPLAGRFHRVSYRPRLLPGGGVEHDAPHLLEAVATCLDAVQAGHGLPDVAAVGVTTFWHGLLGFDAAGHCVTPIFMWSDGRSATEAALLGRALDEAAIHARTGCHLHSSYWPAKLRWLARDRPEEVARVAHWGSFGEYLELELFGEAATTVSMASGTGLLDQRTLAWDTEALAAADIEPDRLFRLCDRQHDRRGLRPRWSRRWPALRGVPWFPAVGDGAAGNVGSDCTDRTRMALNVGTSTALRVMTVDPTPPPRGLWRYRLDRRLALVGGALSEGGNVHAWCRQVLNVSGPDAVETALATTPPDSHGLTVLPFLAGERAPGWRVDRHGLIAGLGLETTAEQIVVAALEGVALRIALVYALLAPLAAPDHSIVASGGALARSPAWTQRIADALGRPLVLSAVEEASSRGAALLALESLGLLPRLEAASLPPGTAVQPDAARHARYRTALRRQQQLDTRV